MPTLASRTQGIGFLTVSDKIMRVAIEDKGVALEQSEEFLALAGGRPGVIITLCSDTAFASQERSLLREIEAGVRSKDMVSLLRVSEQISQDAAQRRQAIYGVTALLRKELMNMPPDKSLAAIVRKIKRIDRIAELIDSTNVNPRLACDVMFLECVS